VEGGLAVVVRLLGEVGVEVAGRQVDLGIPKQRCVLAALAVDVGRVVPVERLVERVWGADIASRTRATLHSYISRLRRALADVDGVAIVRRSGGYALIADMTEPVVDLHRFRDLCTCARRDDVHSVRALTEALALWQGEALTGVNGEWAEAERDRLGQERLAAQHDLVDARLRAGEGGELVAELATRATQRSLDERVAGQYLLALHQAGRTNEALEHYRQVRVRLIEELGAEPRATLQDLHQQVLAADPTLTTTSPGMGIEPGSVVPRQLRPAPTSFVGRDDELNHLDSLLNVAEPSGATVISAITGSGGFGKTWLALRWAHRHLDRFPDGQLFVDLRAFSPDSEPMAPTAALSGFLATLGIESRSIPSDVHVQSALFRSLIAGKRMLVVLDNARDTDQVVPLLPGGETCMVVVTSRNRLAGLVTGYGAHRLSLGALSEGEARGLLAARLGTARVDAENTAVDELISLCGGVPLALSVIAASSGAPLSGAVAELRESGLHGLDDDDPSASLPTVLSWSYRALTEEQAAAFSLLAITPGPDIGLTAAANLTGLPPTRARAVLRGLEQASLLDRDTHGRYRMHDLIRAYATHTVQRLPADLRDAALQRVVDFYSHTAHNADLLLDTHRGPVGLVPPAHGTHVHQLPDAVSAMAWLDSEHATLFAAQHVAAHQQRHDSVWWLALSLDTFHHRRGHRHDRLAMWRAAAHAAEHLPDPTPRLIARRHLGRACAALGLHEEAIGHLSHAISFAEAHNNTYEQAHAHQTLARVWGRRDEHKALEHAAQALRLFRGLDMPLCQAHGHNAVGWYTARLGDHHTASNHFHAALALHRKHHNPTGEANTLDSLGYIAHHTGDHHRAISHYRRALTLRRHLGNAYDSASTLDHLGPPHAALGQHYQARQAWEEALNLYRRQGRNEDAEQVQRQLDTLTHANTNPSAESAK
jgi:DNA-binding SARP family transcriptional activator/tetratricopeptide (TPR) repeat protein